MTKTDRLNKLFTQWETMLPPEVRKGFHRDGIVHEPTFEKQSDRILFVLAEPNSTGGNYDKYLGQDLRPIYGQWKWTKSCNQNVARWTRLLLDGKSEASALSGEEADALNRRSAIMNLKKTSGGGVADQAGIALFAWEHRARLRQQIAIIAPTILVACGKVVNRMLKPVLSDDALAVAPKDKVWRHENLVILPSFHPSLRNRTQTEDGLGLLQERACAARVGAFRRGA